MLTIVLSLLIALQIYYYYFYDPNVDKEVGELCKEFLVIPNKNNLKIPFVSSNTIYPHLGFHTMKHLKKPWLFEAVKECIIKCAPVYMMTYTSTEEGYTFHLKNAHDRIISKEKYIEELLTCLQNKVAFSTLIVQRGALYDHAMLMTINEHGEMFVLGTEHQHQIIFNIHQHMIGDKYALKNKFVKRCGHNSQRRIEIWLSSDGRGGDKKDVIRKHFKTQFNFTKTLTDVEALYLAESLNGSCVSWAHFHWFFIFMNPHLSVDNVLAELEKMHPSQLSLLVVEFQKAINPLAEYKANTLFLFNQTSNNFLKKHKDMDKFSGKLFKI